MEVAPLMCAVLLSLEPNVEAFFRQWVHVVHVSVLIHVPPCDLVRNHLLVFDQKEAESAPLAMQIRQSIFMPFGIYIHQSL